MQVLTTLDALSAAYVILDDLGLAAFISGGDYDIEPTKLANELLRAKKAHAFIAAITGCTEEEAGALGIAEVIDLVTRFFLDTGSALSSLPGMKMSSSTENPAKA